MNSNYPKCCEEWGLNSRVFKNDKWAHQWSTPITQLGKEGYEPCVFDGPTEQLAGFHAVNGLHFQLWEDGVSVLLFNPEEGFSLLALVPLSIWGSVLVAATPQVTPTPVQGLWPKDCPQRHFVEGASWWQFHSQGSTMFASERDQAEAEAVKRFGPVEGTSEQADTIDDGFGNTWSAYCPTCKQKSMYVSRPGDARCAKCETKQAAPTPEKCPTCGSTERSERWCEMLYGGEYHRITEGFDCEVCTHSWHSSAGTPKGTK